MLRQWAATQKLCGRNLSPSERRPGGGGYERARAPAMHVLQSTAESVSPGILDPARPPALTIDTGNIVSYPDTWRQWGNQARYGMSFADREPLRRQFPSGPYSNLGPVEVRGAEPGDVLESRMLRTRPIDWGWNSFPLGVGALPSDFEEPYVHYFPTCTTSASARIAQRRSSSRASGLSASIVRRPPQGAQSLGRTPYSAPSQRFRGCR